MSKPSQQIIVANFNQLDTSRKLKIACQIATVKGFYNYFYEKLPHFKTRKECFEMVNQLHCNLFKEEKYSDYDSFRKSIKYHLKNRR